MLEAPPLFDFAEAVTAPESRDMADGEAWWALADRIAIAVIDAATVEDVEAVRVRNATDIAALVKARRDLARTLSGIFQDRRRTLERGR